MKKDNDNNMEDQTPKMTETERARLQAFKNVQDRKKAREESQNPNPK